MNLKIVNVVGARPNFMKIAPLMVAYRRYPGEFEPLLVHTGQHYDDNMSKLFFDQLNLPKPDVDLGVGSGSHSEQTARVMVELEKLLAVEHPHLVVVVGDVNSTMAAAIVAAKMRIPVAHVEAGLRSFDRTMPEEINRLVTDALSDYCFTTSADAEVNLSREGIAAEKIFFVGNVMIDTLTRLKDAALKLNNRPPGNYGFVTLHRPSNVDSRETFTEIMSALETIDLPLIFPIHPRTAQRMKEFGITTTNVQLTEPLGYLESLNLIAGATVVLTDSGGMQEETTVLGVPCLTIRTNTERPVTITEGTNTLVGTSGARMIEETRKILAGRGKRGRIPKFWDGHAAERIIECLLEHPPKV
jgi:UDP-N-acetylglucosamine 2-epimerase (non-hydrolysing)